MKEPFVDDMVNGYDLNSLVLTMRICRGYVWFLENTKKEKNDFIMFNRPMKYFKENRI